MKLFRSHGRMVDSVLVVAVIAVPLGLISLSAKHVDPSAMLDPPEPITVAQVTIDDATDRRIDDLEADLSAFMIKALQMREQIDAQTADIVKLKAIASDTAARLDRATRIPRRKPEPDPPAASYLKMK